MSAGLTHIPAAARVVWTDDVSDAELVSRAAGGDQAAFETLARRHFPALHAIVLAHVHDADEADDTCQEALVRAWRRLPQCRDPDRFGAWLIRIGRNEARRSLARRSLRRWVGLGDAAGIEAPASPERDLRISETRRRLERALATLPARQREVVLLFDMEGFSHREIAGRLDISEAMSRRLLSDARAAFRRRRATATGADDE